MSEEEIHTSEIQRLLEAMGAEVQVISADQLEFFTTTVAIKDILHALTFLDDELLDKFIKENNGEGIAHSKQYMVPLMNQLVDEFIRPAARFVHDQVEAAVQNNNPRNN